MATNTELLTEIDNAIVEILQNGQEVIHKGTQYTKANIQTLFSIREKYANKVSASNGDDTFFSRMVNIIPRRS